ncbi:MAG: metal-dependent hydrolase [Litoreibacter sp.]|nr:metal-dependent hydrolase [Litoreibacter sp.]
MQHVSQPEAPVLNATGSKPGSAKPIRLASYNIRKLRGLDQTRDRGRFLKIVNALEADVIALQEADRRLGDRPAAIAHRMIEEETDFEVVPVATNEVSLGWHGNAVLVRKGTRVTGISRLTLPGLEPRGAVRVDFNGSATWSMIAVHLGLTRFHRRQQMQTIARELDTHADTPSVVIGDFNEWSRSKGFEPLSETYAIHAPGRSYHAARPVAALDRLALSPGLKLVNAGVEEGPLARMASDHLPIWGDITQGEN